MSLENEHLSSKVLEQDSSAYGFELKLALARQRQGEIELIKQKLVKKVMIFLVMQIFSVDFLHRGPKAVLPSEYCRQ